MSFGEPRLPSETCPTIDKAISLIEEVRDANYDLRKCAIFYRDKAEELEDRVWKAEKRVSELEDEIKEMSASLAALEK